ncbi:MAG: ferrous iron transporter B [Gemmatimonadota bacterium]|nr:ferrous iron transporter B [Gemmatimonadota bacterium]
MKSAAAATRPPHPPGRSRNLVRLGLSPHRWDHLIALAGNPNVGKTTVFNALTGLRQHTGNWPGKTVARAEGAFVHDGRRVKVVDLPGTYSLQAGSADEEIARDFILFGQPDVTVVVVDATRLERNLNLVLQILEITDRVVVCLNLVDEARRHGISVDAKRLERELGVPVVPAVARRSEGIDALLKAATEVAAGARRNRPRRLRSHPAAVEGAVDAIAPLVAREFPKLPNARWVALRLLNADERVTEAVRSGEIGQLGGNGTTGPGKVGREEGGGGVDAGTAAVRAGGSPPSRDDGTGTPGAVLSTGSRGRARILQAATRQRWTLRPGFHDALAENLYREATRITDRCVRTGVGTGGPQWDRKLDRWLTSRIFGFPLMLGILAVVFWLTIAGANVPSAMLATLLLDNVHPALGTFGEWARMPWWLSGFLFDGVYLATAWVVSVMLPPMAIFFPLFTLLEDFGYLPRVAFNLDSLFRRAGAHGKQALTMSMGFGCNAAGVVATRVIDSPRERLIAVITNNFSLCNGRWPTQILIATIFIGALVPPHLAGVVSAGAVVGIALLGIVFMFLTSWGLSRTVLKGEATTFSLELPPYRPPRVLQTLYTSVIDRTLIILWRAVLFAIPAGAVIWLLSNISVGGASLAEHGIGLLDPFGILLGLNGVILLAYVIAIPANEIVIPTVLMLTVATLGDPTLGEGAGVMFERDSVGEVAGLLAAGGWTLLTGVNLMLFSLLHNPCSTTIYTIYKETGSGRWTTLSALLPLAMGFVVCFLVAQAWRLAGGTG